MNTYFCSSSVPINQLPFSPIAKITNKKSEQEKKNNSHIIAVASGKGGVGKTNFVINTALELGLQGLSVTVLDADFALANADVLLGVKPQYHMGHVISGERKLKEIIMPITQKVNLIPASSGLEQLVKLSQTRRTQIINELQEVEKNSNFILIDTPAGIGSNVLNFLLAADDVIIVTMPEPSAMIDAYATIKVLHKQSPNKRIWIVVNNAANYKEAEEVFTQLAKTSTCFLKHKLEYLGAVPRDPELLKAVRERIPVVEYSPNLPSSRSFRLIAKRINLSFSTNIKTSSLWHSLTKPNSFDPLNEEIC